VNTINMKKNLIVAVVVGIAVLFVAAGIQAGNKAADVIKLEAKYPHTKGITQFTHKKHVVEYKAKCGDCHHDDKGKALENLKDGDNVQSCFECHNKPGEKPKGKDAPKLEKKDALKYHAEALHDNCKGCHQDFNKKNNTNKAPTACTKCHPGKEAK